MANVDRSRVIPRGTPESAAMVASVKRAMAITARLNRLTFNDADEVRAVFSELIGKKVDHVRPSAGTFSAARRRRRKAHRD